MSSISWNIFLLEDDDADKMLVQGSLRDVGIPINLVHARTVAEAKEILTGSQISWDCCLLDRSVPDGSGLDLMSHEKIQQVPCIMLTGYQDENVALKALSYGLEDYLMKKDINREILPRAIRYAIERNSLKATILEQMRSLEALVRMDPLTGASNRRGLEELLERLIGRNPKEQYGVILIDLDNFKQINDVYGYDVGDKALKLVSDKLRLTSRPLDHVARVGGDEFLILVVDVDMEQCLAISERIRGGLQETVLKVGDVELQITASMGVSALSGAKSVEDLLKATQEALHRSKKSGKNSVCASPQNEK